MSGADPAGRTDAQRAWQLGVERLISYRYLGTYSVAHGRHDAEGWITIRRDLRGPFGLLAAPLGIALLDTAGINVDPLAVVSPTRIDLHLFEPAADVACVHLEGRVLREGRSQFFTESRLTDADDATRAIGLGSTHWAVAGPNPGFRYVDNRPGVADAADLPPLHEPFGARLDDDGNLEIPELTAAVGRHGLHQGPFQVVPRRPRCSQPSGLWAPTASGSRTRARRSCTGASERPWSRTPKCCGSPITTSTSGSSCGARGADDRLCSVSVCHFVRA